MSHRSTKNEVPEMTVGLDVSDQYIQCAFVEKSGELVEMVRISATVAALKRRFFVQARWRIVIEVGGHSPWLSRELEALGHEVIVANARKVRAIHDNDEKNDKTDAEMLARLGRLDPELLRPIQHRSAEAQAVRALIKSRDQLVQTRTRLVNHIRGVVKSAGGRVPAMSPSAIHKRAQPHIPELLLPALQPLLATLALLEKQIRDYDNEVARLAELVFPVANQLQGARGVGPLTALTYVATIDDPQRFKKSRSVGAYLGLVSKQSQSGDSNPQLRITKAGDPYLRSLLVQAAHYMLGPFGEDSDLRRYGLKIAAQGGKTGKKRAVIAVARKLAVLLHHLWVTGQEYEPLYLASQQDQAA